MTPPEHMSQPVPEKRDDSPIRVRVVRVYEARPSELEPSMWDDGASRGDILTRFHNRANVALAVADFERDFAEARVDAYWKDGYP